MTSITTTQSPNIYFQNGSSNDCGIEVAIAAAKLIEQAIGKKVGLIVKNFKTQNLVDELEFTSSEATQTWAKFAQMQIGANLRGEYLPSSLTLKDALNGEVYQQIASNGNQKNLIIMHCRRQ